MPEPYRVVSALPTGTAFSRYLMVKAAARGDAYTELALAEKFKDSPTVHATLDLETKAAVAAGTAKMKRRNEPLLLDSIFGSRFQARNSGMAAAKITPAPMPNGRKPALPTTENRKGPSANPMARTVA